jgi:protein-disulfide isomerase
MSSRFLSLVTRRWRSILDAALALSMIALGLTLTWQLAAIRSAQPLSASRSLGGRPSKPVPTPSPLPATPVSLAGALVSGRATAPLVVIENADVQCPYCGVFARNIQPDFQKQFVTSGQVMLAYRHFPLEQIHPFAKQGAAAIECAARHGQGWQMLDRLSVDQKNLDLKSILAVARGLSLAETAFSSCMTAADVGTKIARDVAGGRELGVTGTPTFFLGVRQPDGTVKLVERVVGAVALSQWATLFNKWSTK